jgi:SAM-dependent methyltransferase
VKSRASCPICGCSIRHEGWEMEFEIPDGWTLPRKYSMYCCMGCGFVWNDADATQADFDKYYLEVYGTGDSGPLTRERHDSVARQIRGLVEPPARIADFGGGDGYLSRRLCSMGYDAKAWLVDSPRPENCDFIVSLYALEHVWDLNQAIESIIAALKHDGQLLIEVPDLNVLAHSEKGAILDFIAIHVNHFAPKHLDMLMQGHGMEKLEDWHTLYNETGCPCYRALYARPGFLWKAARKNHTNAMKKKAGILSSIQEPVIMWGISSPAWHLLSMTDVSVAYFVDMDARAYPEGTTIRGIPVKKRVDSGEPIVVLAMQSRQDILDTIKAQGLSNKVIVV